MESLKKASGEQNKTYSKIKFLQAYTVIMEDNSSNSIMKLVLITILSDC